MTQAVVFVSGMHRSGTSLLHLMIAAHPKYVGVGEVYGLIKPGSKHLAEAEGVRCSCGEPATQCRFWGKVVARLAQSNEATRGGRYRIFLDAFSAHFGADRIPVDSSKDLKALRALRTIPGLDVKTIYLIRDVRAWSVSMEHHRERLASQGRVSSMKLPPLQQRLFPNSSVRLFWQWYRANRRNQQELQRLDVAWLQLGYEELCLYPTLSFAKISQFLDDRFSDDVLAFNRAEHHGILINPMKGHKKKLAGVFYDNRWFFNQRQWQLPMLMFPNIMNYNNREVYGHVDSPFK